VLKATADTNILVSALVFKRGKPDQFLRMALSGEISLTVSEAILAEMADVLERKFHASPDEIAEATAVVRQAARTVTPAVQLDVIKEDPPDNRVLECAVSAGADYIVTGDKDLLRLGQYDAIRIVKVADFLEIAAKHARGR
jgi:putative PIN family toxin of toxin-antitoxin system